jgi:hypothetical protein
MDEDDRAPVTLIKNCNQLEANELTHKQASLKKADCLPFIEFAINAGNPESRWNPDRPGKNSRQPQSGAVSFDLRYAVPDNQSSRAST